MDIFTAFYGDAPGRPPAEEEREEKRQRRVMQRGLTRTRDSFARKALEAQKHSNRETEALTRMTSTGRMGITRYDIAIRVRARNDALRTEHKYAMFARNVESCRANLDSIDADKSMTKALNGINSITRNVERSFPKSAELRDLQQQYERNRMLLSTRRSDVHGIMRDVEEGEQAFQEEELEELADDDGGMDGNTEAEIDRWMDALAVRQGAAIPRIPTSLPAQSVRPGALPAAMNTRTRGGAGGADDPY